MYRASLSVIFFTILAASGFANQGDPVAIIRLPGGGVAIETMWNHSVVITDSADDLTSTLAGVDIIHGDVEFLRRSGGGRFVMQASQPIDHVLDRPANRADATWKPASQAGKVSSNAVRVRTISTAILVETDGVRIVHVASPLLPPFTRDEAKLTQGCDVLIIDGDAETNTKSKAIAQIMAAKQLIVRSKRKPDDTKTVSGNTIAISSASQVDTLQVSVLRSTPIELSSELADLYKRMESANKASQKVFEALSIGQLNFRPSNGTHTPRWNAEHMMGRELLFFSQIFHAQDPVIPIMDLNPKQMPPDYVAKHPDWTGSEEARQMERVSAFSRRFAYLLQELPLDRKAPGSGWTPRKLLLQMERHYNEHTANVKKKFDLPDWPEK